MRRTGKCWSEPTMGTVVCATANRSEGPLAFGFKPFVFDCRRDFDFDFFFFARLAFAITNSGGYEKTGNAGGKCADITPLAAQCEPFRGVVESRPKYEENV